jgi:hypothetical protein
MITKGVYMLTLADSFCHCLKFKAVHRYLYWATYRQSDYFGEWQEAGLRDQGQRHFTQLAHDRYLHGESPGST